MTESPSREADAARAMNGLRRIVRALRAGDSEIERAIGVSSAQLFALRQIVRRPGGSVSDLAASTLTTQSSISEVVTRLVQRGLVTKKISDGDHRKSLLEATTAGRAALANAPETTQERLLAALARLSATKRRQLATRLDELLVAAGLETLEATMFFEESFIESPQRARGRRRFAGRTVAGIGGVEGSPEVIDEGEST